MKKIKFMLVALMAVFGFNGAMAAELVNSTQYDTNGFQYVIKSLTKTGDTWSGTVSMKQNTFSGTSITINPTVPITVEGTVSGVACKGTITFDIVEIEADGFKGLSDVTSITFADGCKITKIGAGAFAGTSIANLDLTNTGITKLEKLFEDNNTALKTVVLPASLTEVADYALEHCFALSSINAEKSTKLATLGKNCFGDNAVVTLDLSKTVVTSLESNPFVGHGGSGEMNKTLKHLILPVGAAGAPGTVTKIGTGLANLYNLLDVNLEKTKLVDVPAGAFENDKSLTSLEFPKTLKNIRESNMFKGCESLATLRICYDALTAVGYGTNNFFVAASADDDKTESALKTLEFFTTSATTYDFKAYVGSSAFANCKGITTVKIAVGDDIAAAAEFKAGTIALSNGEASTVQMGNLKNAPEAGFIVGPTAATVAATVTIGDVATAQTQATGIVSGNIGTFTVGKLSAAFAVEAIGQAQTIVFSGDITTALTTTGAVPNARLTTIDFGSIKIADVDDIIPATAFNETNAPLLTAVTWTPTIVKTGSDIYNPVNHMFNIAAFAVAAKDAAAKITFTTVPEIADLYPAGAGGSVGNELDKSLYNVIFAFVSPDVFEAIKVYGPADAAVYVGYFNCPATGNYSIDKKQGDAIITVYSAFLDASDNKIYMDPLMIVDGKFIVRQGQTVIVRSTTSDDVKAYASDATTTMRYYDADGDNTFDDPDEIVNELKYTATAISADQLGTQYYDHGQYVYYMQNPTTATGINFRRLDETQYLFAKAVYIVKAGLTSAARLEVVWLDGDSTTAIKAIERKANVANDAIYNLSGQRVDASYKGVVIKNGKKYFQK